MDNIAVVGGGNAGRTLAGLVARSGQEVTLIELTGDLLDLDTGAARGLGDSRGASPAADHDAGDGVRTTTDFGDLRDADLVIEAVTDDLEVKTAVLARISASTRDDTVIVTTTSTLSVSALVRGIARPQRGAGMHRSNPAAGAGVVEVVRAVQTDDATCDAVAEFAASSLGEEVVRVEDRPGFLVNRLLLPFLNDVIQALDDDLATAEDIDTAVRLGLGYAKGPLELLDGIGLDVHQRATARAHQALGDAVYAPPPLLQALVAAGRVGRGVADGFHSKEARA